MNTLNKGLYNFLNDICEQPRWACYKKGEEVVVYLCGGNYFTFDGKIITSKILNNTKVKVKDIDLKLVLQIFNKLFETKDLRSSDEKLKEQYKITHKRVTSKDREIIAKYEEAIKRNSK